MIHNKDVIKSMLRPLTLIVFALTFSLKVQAEVIFEGYYKVTLSGVHAGYVIQRYEFDATQKLFTGKAFTYVRITPDGKQFINESLVAKANDKFQPVSYNYSGLIASLNEQTGRIENNVTLIDATFQGQKMTLKGLKSGKNFSSKTTYPQGAFLSNFLLQLMLQKGLAVGRNFRFEAIAEETGMVHKGQVQIVAEEQFKGANAFKINWAYKDVESTSYISTNGNALGTESPAQKVAQVLVANPSEATAGFTLPQQSIKKIFGNIPAGNVHDFAKPKSSTTSTPPEPVNDGTNSAAKVAPPAVIVKPPAESNTPTKSQ